MSDEEISKHYRKQQRLAESSTESLVIHGKALTKKERRAAKKLDKKLLKLMAKKGKKANSCEIDFSDSDDEISLNEDNPSCGSIWVHMICTTGRFIRRWLCMPKHEEEQYEAFQEKLKKLEIELDSGRVSPANCKNADEIQDNTRPVSLLESNSMNDGSLDDLTRDSKKYMDDVDLMVHEMDSLDDILADIEKSRHYLRSTHPKSHSDVLSDNDSIADDTFKAMPKIDTEKSGHEDIIDESEKNPQQEELVIGLRRKKRTKPVPIDSSNSSKRSFEKESKCEEEYDSSYPEASSSHAETPISNADARNIKKPEDLFVPLSDDEVDEGIEGEYYNSALNCIVKTMPVRKKKPMFREIQLQNPVQSAKPPLKPLRKGITFEVGTEAKAQEWLISKRIPENIREKLRTPDRRERVFSRNEIDMKMLRAEEKRLKLLEVKKSKSSPKKIDTTMLERMEEERRKQLQIHLDKKMNDAESKREEKTELIKNVSFNLLCFLIF